MKVVTQYPIALDSEDHLHPHGAYNDNHGNGKFVEEIENHFDDRKIVVMDLGCAGGGLALEFHNRGHLSIGLEGSDCNLKRTDDNVIRKQWAEFNGTVLHTCDISHPFRIVDENEQLVQFDLITSWECFEHIIPDRMDNVLLNIALHLKDDGIFVGSINTLGESSSGRDLHVNKHGEWEWRHDILPKYFEVEDYPFKEKVRLEGFSVLLRKKKL